MTPKRVASVTTATLAGEGVAPGRTPDIPQVTAGTKMDGPRKGGRQHCWFFQKSVSAYNGPRGRTLGDQVPFVPREGVVVWVAGGEGERPALTECPLGTVGTSLP